MPQAEYVALVVAGISVVGVTVTAILNGLFQRRNARAQVLKDICLAELNAHAQQDRITRERFEAFFAEINDLLAQPIEESSSTPAHIRFAKAQKAAYALLAHSDPELAMAALDMTRALSNAYRSAAKDGDDKYEELTSAASALTKSFIKEVARVKAAREQAVSAAVNGA